jgi:hypothetical protein
VAAYVRSGGFPDGESDYVRNKLYTTLNAGLAMCRSGKGDYVVVYPDHAENIDAADKMSSLVAGTNIIGLGYGNLRPTFTWTVGTATLLFDVANVSLNNCILHLCSTANGGVTVVAPILVSAAGCSINDCRIMFGGDADDIVTIGITTTAAGDDFTFDRNECFGATAAECTTFRRLVGADRFKMRDCVVIGATSSTTVGVIQFLTTASTDVLIDNCVFENRKASSIHAATGMTGATGWVRNCSFGIGDNATLTGFVTEGSLYFSHNKTVNLASEEGATKTVVSA